jgi:tyrosine-protein phosphatase non-receptor type 4
LFKLKTASVASCIKNIWSNSVWNRILDDTTRVILKNAASGDYINANYVNMKINGTDITNNYIATQGPLQSTSEDFWQMVLEENCNLIVMLTTIVERGRAKCHKYWPNPGECLTMENMIVNCIREETDAAESFVFRDFILTDVQVRSPMTQECRKVYSFRF